MSAGTAITGSKPKGAGTRIGGTKNTAATWAAIRTKRNALLTACDWTQVPDSPLTPELKAAWATYRTALRNLTATDHVAKVAWPTPPGGTNG